MGGKDQYLAKTDGLCAYCAVVLTMDRLRATSFEKEHVVARAKGGPDVDWNIVRLAMLATASSMTPMRTFSGRGLHTLAASTRFWRRVAASMEK